MVIAWSIPHEILWSINMGPLSAGLPEFLIKYDRFLLKPICAITAVKLTVINSSHKITYKLVPCFIKHRKLHT